MPMPTPDDDDEMSLDEHRALVAKLATEATVLNDRAAESGTSALVPVANGVGDAAKAAKTQMAQIKRDIGRKQAELRAATKALKERMDREIREAERILGPLQERVKMMEEGIWTINLYLGRDEEIVKLRSGEPAPADTPITVRQAVLSMDQECMMASDTGEAGLDARDMESFDRWLLADPAHLDQVLPEIKGIRVFVPRRTPKDYKDPWVQKAMDEANRHSYWLIRNGGLLWRMSTDFDVGKTLVPTEDEFTSFFMKRGFHGEESTPIEPGTRDWAEAEKAANGRQRHFMRVALILQGIVDRTKALAPLPGRVNLLTPPSYDAGHVRIVTDEERNLTDGRFVYKDWARDLRSKMTVGMRVVGHFDGYSSLPRNYRDHYDDHEQRIFPNHAPRPPKDEIFVLERPAKGNHHDFVIRYDRNDSRWMAGVHMDRDGTPNPHGGWIGHANVPYTTRASCFIERSDTKVIPYDLVTEADMDRLLNDRLSRMDYLDMMPVFKAVKAAKAAEAEAEAPFRLLLAGELVRQNGVTAEEAEEAVPQLVHDWKLANRYHRALTGEPEHEAKAIRMIVAEHAARLGITIDQRADEAAVGTLLARFPKAMLIARRRDGSIAVVEPENDATPYVCIRNLSGKRLSLTETRRWATLGLHWKKWRVLHSTDRWETWDHTLDPADYLTDEETANLLDATRSHMAHHPKAGNIIAIVTDGRNLTVWAYMPNDFPERPDGLLSRGWGNREVHQYTYGWERRAEGIRVKYPDTMRDGGGLWGHTFHIESVFEKNRAWYPWEIDSDAKPGHAPTVTAVLFVNGISELFIKGARARRRAWEAEAAPMHTVVNRAYRSLMTQWQAKWEAEQHAEFLEDYLDPDLWDDHLANLGRPDPPFWFHSQLEGKRPTTTMTTEEDENEDDDEEREEGAPAAPTAVANLHLGLEHLVERGHDINGLTVAELRQLHQEVMGFPIGATHRRFGGTEPIEDILDCVIDTTPEPDDPDDEEEFDDELDEDAEEPDEPEDDGVIEATYTEVPASLPELEG